MEESKSRIAPSSADPYAGLLPALRASDPSAQSRFFDQVAPGLVEILIGAFHGALGRQDCEDLVIEAGLKFFESISRYDPDKGARLTTWFTTIAMNLARDECRRRARNKKRTAPTPWIYAPSNPKLQTFFVKALEHLTEGEREYLMLWRFGRGMEAGEIATALELKPGAARKRKHGLLKKLAGLLRGEPELYDFLQQVVGTKAEPASETNQPSTQEEE